MGGSRPKADLDRSDSRQEVVAGKGDARISKPHAMIGNPSFELFDQDRSGVSVPQLRSDGWCSSEQCKATDV